MSGGEAFAVLGVIGSIVTIIDGTKQAYDSVRNAQGLPQAFREVAGRLPIVRTTLNSAKQNIDDQNVDESSCKAVLQVAEACKEKAKKLDDLFHKACPSQGASDVERYYKAVKGLGKGHKVEDLMKGMLEDVHLLACERGMRTATGVQQEQVLQAITDMSALPSSVPEQVYREISFAASNFGLGTQNIAQGDAPQYNAQDNARQYNSAGGAMNFGHTLTSNTKNEFSIHISALGDAHNKCMAALFLTDPRDDRKGLEDLKGSIVDGTCKWIESHTLYESWLHSQSQLLWLSGGPGKGKTMLSIFLAEGLEENAKHSRTTTFLQFFCDNKDEKRRTATAILRGLIYQLLLTRREMFDHILPEFNIQKESLFTASSFQTLWRIFETMLRDPILGPAFCVLDGLDECEEKSLDMLLRKIPKLFEPGPDGSPASQLKLLITSRDLPVMISEVLSSFPRIDLDSDADIEVNKDIERFIDITIYELSSHKQYPPHLHSHVKKVFQERAQGTFLWVGIVANMLRQYPRTEVEKALDLFPAGLDEVYARILLQVRNDRREIVARLLRWIVVATRPLTLVELGIATDVPDHCSSNVTFSRKDIIRDQVLYCGNLLAVREDEVSLVHQSAKDYLLRTEPDQTSELKFFRVKAEPANLEITKKCLEYLETNSSKVCDAMRFAWDRDDFDNLINLDDPFANNDRPHLGRRYSNYDVVAHSETIPFLKYAVTCWPVHAKPLSSSAEIFDLSRAFFCDKSQSRASWLEIYRRWSDDLRFGSGRSFKETSLIRPTLLHIASYLGILPLAEKIIADKSSGIARLKRSSYVNKKDKSGNSALYYAIRGGNEAMVRLLLDNGSKVRNKHGKGSVTDTKIHLATSSGNTRIVQYLLDSGADVDLKDLYNKETPLILAAAAGDHAMVSLLLDNRASVHASGSLAATALHKSAGRGSEAVTRMLLDKGANIEAQNEGKQTALHISAEEGREAVTQILLENWANIEAKDEDEETALHVSARRGSEAVTRMLLDKGANIKAQNEKKQTALHFSALSGNEAITRILLDKGANIDAKDDRKQTALHFSALSESEAITRMLLDKGANIDAKDSNKRTALHNAPNPVGKGCVEVVRLLVERGADIGAIDGNGRTALECVNEELLDPWDRNLPAVLERLETIKRLLIWCGG